MLLFTRLFYCVHIVCIIQTIRMAYSYYGFLQRNGFEHIMEWQILLSVTSHIVPIVATFLAFWAIFRQHRKVLHISSILYITSFFLFFVHTVYCVGIAFNITLASLWTASQQQKEAFPFHWVKLLNIFCLLHSFFKFVSYSLSTFFSFINRQELAAFDIDFSLRPIILASLVLAAAYGCFRGTRRKNISLLLISGIVLVSWGCLNLYSYFPHVRWVFTSFPLGPLTLYERALHLAPHLISLVAIAVESGSYLALPFANYNWLQYDKERTPTPQRG